MTKVDKKIQQNIITAEAVDFRSFAYDVVFILNINSRGWILEKICKIIGEESGLHYGFVFVERNDRLTFPIPRARKYFFAHYSIAYNIVANYPEVCSSELYVWFTHLDQAKNISLDSLSLFFNTCEKVFTANSFHRRTLISCGVREERVATVLGGADPEMFRPHARGGRTVGIVGAYYERKRPDRILEVVSSMPDVNFVLVGPGYQDVDNPGLVWRNWPRFPELLSFSNFEYVEARYEDYPKYYERMDVYLSLSELEGGPIPVIEAMMTNVIPIATKTGFAADVLRDGLAEFLLDITEETSSVCAKVRRALEDRVTDVSALSQHLSWSAFGKDIAAHMQPSLEPDITLDFSQGGRGIRFLRNGWERTHLSGVKAKSIRPGLSLPIDFRDSTMLRLDARVRKEVGDERSGQVALQINGAAAPPVKLSSSQMDIVAWANPGHRDALEVAILRTGSSSGDPISLSNPDLIFESLRIRPMGLTATNDFDFSVNGGLSGHLSSNWYWQEDSGVWSMGPSAYIMLPIVAQEPAPKTVSIFGRILGSEFESAAQMRVCIHFSDRVVEHVWSFASDDACLETFDLPPIAAGESGPILVHFERSRSFVPTLIREGVWDPRDLGFFLRTMSLCSEPKPWIAGN